MAPIDLGQIASSLKDGSPVSVLVALVVIVVVLRTFYRRP